VGDIIRPKIKLILGQVSGSHVQKNISLDGLRKLLLTPAFVASVAQNTEIKTFLQLAYTWLNLLHLAK
jgi:hypothetical protein